MDKDVVWNMSNIPKVTVLMPVYNGEEYLREAIESILGQSFTDFELLIINDGSTDRSVEIIQSYRDPRIRLVHNERNMGLVPTLNKGVKLANGEYIARMDADDISLPERFAKEVLFLDSHPLISVVSVKALLINAKGTEDGLWLADKNTTTWSEIYQLLPKENCVVHPGVMIRKEVIANYGFNPKQKDAEDYDLWLRIASDGHKIEKIDEELLKYRIHSNSITTISKTGRPLRTLIFAKYNYLLHKIAKKQFNGFDIKVLLCLIEDIILNIVISVKAKTPFRNKFIFYK